MSGVRLSPPPSHVTYSKGANSAFCVSIDFDAITQDREKPNKEGTIQLLGLSEKYSIPMTWAICGQTVERDSKSYDRIRRSKEPQEIGIHTYSHADVSACAPNKFREEIDRCLRVLDLPYRPKSFVFPWNRLGNFEVLLNAGFIAYRARNRMISPPVFGEERLWNIAPTYHADRKTFHSLAKIKKLVRIAIENNSIFHLWLHPWDMIPDSQSPQQDIAATVIEPLFKYVYSIRAGDSDALEFSTMGDLAICFQKQIV